MNDVGIILLIIGVGCLFLAVGAWLGDRIDSAARDARRTNRR